MSSALTPEEIAQTALASTVLIVIQGNLGRSSFGSEFVIGEGQIATNAHVVEGASSGTVKLVGAETEHAIDSILAIDRAHDLAIVEATGITASALSFGDSDTLQVAQSVYAAGNPHILIGHYQCHPNRGKQFGCRYNPPDDHPCFPREQGRPTIEYGG